MGIFINTCLSEVMIGLVETGVSSVGSVAGGMRLLELETWKADRQESKKLMPKIVDLLERNGSSKDDLDCIYLVTGPGSFTAVRIGFIVGKALAEGLGLELRVCTTFEFLKNGLDGLDYRSGLMKAGGKMVYVVDLENGSFEMKDVNEVENFDEMSFWIDISKKHALALGLDESKVFSGYDGFDFVKALTEMGLVDDLEGLEPNYVKEANIT
jgi:tRNA threonylcarbamoyl adenosine modification protein YeaZ